MQKHSWSGLGKVGVFIWKTPDHSFLQFSPDAFLSVSNGIFLILLRLTQRVEQSSSCRWESWNCRLNISRFASWANLASKYQQRILVIAERLEHIWRIGKFLFLNWKLLMICFWSLFLQSDHTGHDEKIGNRGPSLRRGTPPLLQQEHLETFPSKTYRSEMEVKYN